MPRRGLRRPRASQRGLSGCRGFGSFSPSLLKPYFRDATTWNRLVNVDPTDLNTVLQTTETATTDVIVRDRYYEGYCGFKWWGADQGRITGLATCDELEPLETWCGLFTVRYSDTWGDVQTPHDHKALACHENGHVFGLGHRGSEATSSCLRPGAPWTSKNLDAHDVATINREY